jgi:isochorismate synthases
MTKEDIYKIIDKLIEQNRSFAIYRTPEDDSPNFVIQKDNNITFLYDIEELNGLEGFVISPFKVTKDCPIILIRPDIRDLNDCSFSDFISTPTPVCDEFETADYKQAFDVFLEALKEHDFEKLVLSRSNIVDRKDSFSVGRAFYNACDKYIYSCVYLFHTPVSGTWMGSTPEILLSGKGEDWQTIALAGTQFHPGKNHGVEWDEKNRKEQELVSSYIQNQLSSVNVKAEQKGPYTVKAGDLVHLRTDFRFNLPDKNNIGSLLKLLHPTPAVSGLPKDKAYKFISNNEGYDRKYYSGFLGMLGKDSRSDLYVNLRCMSINKKQFKLYAGGGLLSSSSFEEEWNETEYKLQTMLKLIK